MTDIDEARVVLSEMTEITEQTIEWTFHRHPDLDALYRECPTAFWLAPDADLTIPKCEPGVPVVTPPLEATPAVVAGRTGAMVAALLAAGPVFTALLFGLNEGAPGEPWWQPLARMAGSLVLTPLTVLVGAILGLIPILFGTLILSEGATYRPSLQHLGVWLGTGGLIGAGIAALFDAGGSIGLCLIATSIACAGIARHRIHWDAPEFA